MKHPIRARVPVKFSAFLDIEPPDEDGEVHIDTGDDSFWLTADDARALGLALLVMGSNSAKPIKEITVAGKVSVNIPLWEETEDGEMEPAFEEAIDRAERDGIPERIKWVFEDTEETPK